MMKTLDLLQSACIQCSSRRRRSSRSTGLSPAEHQDDDDDGDGGGGGDHGDGHEMVQSCVDLSLFQALVTSCSNVLVSKNNSSQRILNKKQCA